MLWLKVLNIIQKCLQINTQIGKGHDILLYHVKGKVVKGLGKADIFSMIFGFHLDKNIVHVFI